MASRKMKECYSVNFRKRWWEVIDAQPEGVRVAVYDNLMRFLFDGCTQPLDGEAGIIWALISEDIEKDIKNTERKPKVEKGKSLEERRDAFVKSLEAYVPTYGKDMMNSFYRYWSQKTQVGDRMLWEAQQAFELGKRLETWARKNNVKKIEVARTQEATVSGMESIRRSMSNGR